jgi:hypothetical protein
MVETRYQVNSKVGLADTIIRAAEGEMDHRSRQETRRMKRKKKRNWWK